MYILNNMLLKQPMDQREKLNKKLKTTLRQMKMKRPY